MRRLKLYFDKETGPIVVKASGLAAGKGVISVPKRGRRIERGGHDHERQVVRRGGGPSGD